MKTLKQVLDENNAPYIIDYVAMDIESAEYPSIYDSLLKKIIISFVINIGSLFIHLS